ncbi:chloride channel protein [Lactobacillus hominis]|uniref:chloride channel protein n=1 Tax=Lactobacillus hominis TaxID=1203033 RepID=UPI0023F54245|nr:chloride channel protein [Lactobacillus hominis]
MENIEKNKTAYIASLIITTIVIGVAAGLGADALGYILSFFESLFLSFKESAELPVSIHINPWQRFFSVFAGSIIAAIVWYFLHKKWHLTSVNEALEGKKMSFVGISLHDFIQTFYIGTGGSVGREAAPREFAAMLAQKWLKLCTKFEKFKLTNDDYKLILAAAAGAGLAGQYVAPLSGTFFALEILYKKVSRKSIAVCLSMSVIGTLLGTLRDGFTPYYIILHKNLSFNLVPFAIFLGIVLGYFGFVFRKYVAKAKKNRIEDKKILFTLPLAGLMTGAVAYFYPYIMGNGRGIAQMAYNTRHMSNEIVMALLICLIAKAVVTTYTIYSGAYGGILTPSISIGAAFGVLTGMIYVLIFPQISLFECGLVGSVAFLTASQQAPLLAIFLVFELCHLDVSALIPMGIAAGVSICIGIILSKEID